MLLIIVKLLTNSEDFVDGGDGFGGFDEAVLDHGDHAIFDGFLEDVVAGDIGSIDEFLDGGGHDQDFVDADAAFVAEVMAFGTAFAFVEFDSS